MDESESSSELHKRDRPENVGQSQKIAEILIMN